MIARSVPRSGFCLGPGPRDDAGALRTGVIMRILRYYPRATVGDGGMTSARSGAEALMRGRWNRRAMATVEAWFVS
jgi:hypothetical protein